MLGVAAVTDLVYKLFQASGEKDSRSFDLDGGIVIFCQSHGHINQRGDDRNTLRSRGRQCVCGILQLFDICSSLGHGPEIEEHATPVKVESGATLWLRPQQVLLSRCTLWQIHLRLRQLLATFFFLGRIDDVQFAQR